MFDARLQTLLGGRPDRVTYAQYLTLIKNPSAVESADLDYKGEQYGKGTDGAGELAKDVAALANANGGTLILGLREDRATSIPQQANPQPLTDRLRKNYRETLVLRLDPPVECDIHFVPEDPGASVPRGLVVISVPPSARVPHAVVGTTDLRDGTLRFPYRNDNHTAHMNLAQVKQAIAAARALASGRHDVLNAAHKAVATDGRNVPGPRMVLSVVPDLPGAFSINSASLHTFRQEETDTDHPFYERSIFQCFGVGPRRFIATQSESRSRHVAHFHTDGTAAWATEGPVINAFRENDSPLPELAEAWHSDQIVIAVLGILQHLARHATVRAKASGTATARITLDSATPRERGLAANHGGQAHTVFSPTVQYNAVGQAGFLLDAAGTGTTLVQAAAALLADCYQHFGVAEADQLTLDGRIHIPAWGPRFRESVTAWAADNDVPLTG
ncbi:AlbA family DNA-binding domain-containing protein [Streptomyces sp. NPDC002755]